MTTPATNARAFLIDPLEANYPSRERLGNFVAMLEHWGGTSARFWVGSDFEYAIGDALAFSVDFYGRPWVVQGLIVERTAEYVELHVLDGGGAGAC